MGKGHSISNDTMSGFTKFILYLFEVSGDRCFKFLGSEVILVFSFSFCYFMEATLWSTGGKWLYFFDLLYEVSARQLGPAFLRISAYVGSYRKLSYMIQNI